MFRAEEEKSGIDKLQERIDSLKGGGEKERRVFRTTRAGSKRRLGGGEVPNIFYGRAKQNLMTKLERRRRFLLFPPVSPVRFGRRPTIPVIMSILPPGQYRSAAAKSTTHHRY